jgi:hypothetical protein
LGNLYAGGIFNQAGGLSATNAAKWNGGNWSSLGTGPCGGFSHGEVQALAFDKSGHLYAGGFFGGTVAATTNVAEFDGNAWTLVGYGGAGIASGYTSPDVLCLAVDIAGILYAGGGFGQENNANANFIAKYDGRAWSAIGAGMTGGSLTSVYSFAFDPSGNLYAGGQFLAAGGAFATNLAKWNGASWSYIGYGAGESASLLGAVFGLGFDRSGKLFAGGVRGLAEWNGSIWSNVSLQNGNASVSVIATAPSGNLYVGGAFPAVAGVESTNISEWDGTNWLALGSGVNGQVSAITFDHLGNVYAGGSFTMAGTVAVTNVAEWNGTAWLPLGPGVPSAVRALVCDNAGNIYAGEGTHVVAWNGTNWTELGSGMNSLVDALEFDNSGNLFAGGSFTSANGVAANYIAKWNGTNWSPLGSGMNGSAGASTVWSLAIDPTGNLYAGGYFTSAGTNLSYHIAEAFLSKSSYSLGLANLGGGTNIITGLGTPGYSYALDFTTNLAPPTVWTPEATNTLSSQSLIFTNVSTSSNGFYRMRYVGQ